MDQEQFEEYLKQQKRMWNFIISAVMAERAEAEMQQFRENLAGMMSHFNDLVKMATPRQLPEIHEAIARATFETEKRHEFFALREDDPQAPEIRETLAEVDMTERQFETAAFAATGKKVYKISEFLKNAKPSTDAQKQEMESIRGAGIEKAKEALVTYKNGDPKVFATLLADGLKYGCEVFSQAGKIDEALVWSQYADEVFGILTKDPVLLKESGLDDYQINVANEIIGLGKTIKEGMEAVEMLSKAALNGQKPAIDTEILQEKVLRMHQASFNRTLVDVQEKWKSMENRISPEGLEEKPLEKKPIGKSAPQIHN